MATGGIKFYQYLQETPAHTWIICHAFGAHPLVETNVYVNGKLEKAFPLSITHIDLNNVKVMWSSPRTGTASLASTQI